MNLSEHIDESGQLKQSKTKRYKCKTIETFGKTSASIEDMAAILRTSVVRIQQFMDEPKSKFCRAYRRGQALMKQHLKLHALKVALGAEKGSPALLSYLENSELGHHGSKQKQADGVVDNTEDLLQKISVSRKRRIFNMFFGFDGKQEKIDEGDNE
jgi:hypothetical protein